MKKTIAKQYNRALIQPETIDQQARTVDVVFASETPVFRWNWEEEYNEILVCEESAMCRERADKGLPVLDNHDTYTSALKTLGRTTKIWFDEVKREGCATIKFSNSRNGKQLLQDVKDGIITDVSVGYRVFKFEREENDVDKYPNYRAVKWQPFEISFVPVPADPNARVRSSEEANEVEILDKSNKHNNPQKRQIMIKVECPTCGHEWEAAEAENYSCPECAAEFTPLAAGEDAAEAAMKTAVEKEKTDGEEKVPTVEDEKRKISTEKIAQIRAQADAGAKSKFNAILLSVRTADLPLDYAVELFELGYALEECYKKIIEKKSEMENEKRKIDPTHTAKVTSDNTDKRRGMAVDALLARANPAMFKVDTTNPYRGMSMVRMAEEMLRQSGVNVSGKTSSEIADITFGNRAHSTSDFPLLFEDALHKTLRAQYENMPEQWAAIASQTSVSDFREKNLYQIDSVNGMHVTPEGGEIKYTTILESKASIRVAKIAQGIRFTREAFINDDLDALSVLPAKFARDWDEWRGDKVWELIINNVVMHDGTALFHANHRNLAAGVNSAFSEEGLTVALQLFRKQTGLDGKRRIRVQPRTIIVPVELEIKAKKLLTATTPANTGDVNPFANMYNIIVEPRLEDPTAWYLVASPNEIDGLKYAYLDGNAGLRIHSEEKFNTDTMDYAVRGEFGAAAIDWRGMVKMKGV